MFFSVELDCSWLNQQLWIVHSKFCVMNCSLVKHQLTTAQHVGNWNNRFLDLMIFLIFTLRFFP